MAAYKIVYQGKIRAGLSRNETLKILAKLSRMDPDKAEARFFAGKSVILRRFSRLEEALAFKRKLDDAGLVVDVLSEPEVPPPTSVVTKTVDSPVAVKGPDSPVVKKEQVAKPQGREDKDAPVEAVAGTKPQDDDKKKVSQTVSAGMQRPVHKPMAPLQRRKAIRVLLWSGLALFLLLTIAAGGLFYYLNTVFDSSAPEIVQRAEVALNNKQTLLLGHINLARIVRLEQIATQMASGEQLLDPESIGLLNDLVSHGIDIRSDFDQIVFAVQGLSAETPYISAVITGRFNPKNVISYLYSEYETATDNVDGSEIIRFKKQDRQTCEYTVERAALIENGLLIVSRPDHVTSIYQALKQKAPAVRMNSEWLTFRSSHLASVGVLQWDKVMQTVPGMGGMILSGLQNQLGSIQSVFVGIAGQTLPPGLRVEAMLKSNDQKWASATAEKLRKGIKAKAESAKTGIPLVALIHKRIAIDDQEGRLKAVFKVDKALVGAAKEALNEGVGAMMSFATNMPGGEAASPEMVDPDAQPYLAQADPQALASFEAQPGENYGWIEGPLAAKVDEVRITPEGLLEMELHVIGQKIPNAPDNDFGGSGELTIASVSNRQGDNLLREETCGREMNTEPVLLKKRFGEGEIFAVKTLRLKEDTDIRDVTALNGTIMLKIASQTETHLLPVPLKEMVFKHDALRLRFKRVAGGTVDYVVSGDRSRLLSLRGLNADKQYLRSAGASSFGSVESTTQSISRRFQGDVKFVEIVTVKQLRTVQFDLFMQNPMPIQQSDGVGKPLPANASYLSKDWADVSAADRTFPPESSKSWYGDPVAETNVGPVRLSLYTPEVIRRFDGTVFGGRIQVAMPYVMALDSRANRVALLVQSIRFKSGKTVTKEHRADITLGFSGGVKDLSLSEKDLRKSIYLKGGLALDVLLPKDSGIDETDRLEAMSGRIMFHMPQSVIDVPMIPLALGNRVGAQGFEIEVVAIGSGKLTLSITGDGSQLVDVLILNPEGKVIASGPVFAEEMVRMSPLGGDEKQMPPRRVADLNFNGIPAQLLLVVADESRTYGYAFTLTPTSQKP